MPVFTVIIPTHQRRQLVLEALAALKVQEGAPDFEVVVVVDGSKDGTLEALRGPSYPFVLKVVAQPRQGLARARNQGAERAEGEYLLFLDDDMEASPTLLLEHERSLKAGAQVVLGHIPNHDLSRAGFLSRDLERWSQQRLQRLERGAGLELQDLLCGQMSIGRAEFERLGGFDCEFTRGGSYGHEDLDFLLRARAAGLRLVFNGRATSRQKYLVSPAENLARYFQVGQAAVVLARKHPEAGRAALGAERRELAGLRGWRGPLRWLTLAMLRLGLDNGVSSRLFYRVRDLEFWRGVRAAGGAPLNGSTGVLCYHSIAANSECPILRNYTIAPEVFAAQLETLRGAGYHFIDPEQFLNFVSGAAALPERSLLLTFDDAYRDFAESAWPILRRFQIRPVLFAVSAALGYSNFWDRRIGAESRALLNAAELERLRSEGVEIGSHSRTHRRLERLSGRDLEPELSGSMRELERAGLGRSRFFAYPHGTHSRRVRGRVAGAGYEAAFGLGQGCVRALQSPWALPRMEVWPWDQGEVLLRRVSQLARG